MIKKFIIGIDLGGTNLKCSLLDNKLKIRARNSFSTKSFNSKEKLIRGLADSINNFILSSGYDAGAILGVGIGVPGPVDTFKGIVHFLPNIPGWKEVNLKKVLEKKTGLKVFIDNDARLMSLAESKIGAARGFSNVLCLTLGTGVGGGLILNNLLYRGKDNAAGEFGHVPINITGPKCGCGSEACIETYIGNNAIKKSAVSIFGAGISLEKISYLARNNNRKAVKFWNEAGKKLGIALSGAVNLLNLDAVVIGGGVSSAGWPLFEGIKQAIAKRSMSVQGKRVKIYRAKLGVDAGIIGAGYLVKERLGI
ncbi:MAG: ROK family protein [Candidatus Omnitrophica bacterium]|nr:ROK family protein [Candidatus Omnitrophota bacterium]